MKIIVAFVTIFWLVLGGYFGAAGWLGSKVLQSTAISENTYYEFDGLSFAGPDALGEFLRQKTWGPWFPWLFGVVEVAPLVAAVAFGLVGGSARTLADLSFGTYTGHLSSAFTRPLFGAVMGALLYFLSLVVPAAFIAGSNPLRPETLAGFALFGGMFSEHAYHWIEAKVRHLFS